MLKALFVVAILLILPPVYANSVASTETKIKYISSYNQHRGGDVIFVIEQTPTACASGYWLTKDDPGFNANFTMLISAYHAKNKVIIYGSSDQLWPGSSGKFCKLNSISYR